MSTPFHLFNLGFLLYSGDTAAGRSDVIAAPRVPLAPHQPMLILSLDSVLSFPDGLKAELNGGLLFIDIDGLAVEGTGKSGPAQLNDFQHVPDFKEFASGVSLKPRWRRSGDLQFRYDLTSGSLSAFHLLGREMKGWNWRTPHGAAKAACFTDITHYLTDLGDSPGLAFRSVAGTGDVQTLTFKPQGAVWAGLVNLPVKKVEAAAEDVDFAHVHAMFTLCETVDSAVAFGAEGPCQTTLTAQSGPGGALGKILSDLGIRLFGRPHCGGRQMSE